MKYVTGINMRKMAFFTVSGLVYLLLLNACSLNKTEVKDNADWKKEILYAEECGFDGLKCCTDGAQACKYGQNCCINPKNNTQNFCAESCELGTKNSFCRDSDPACDTDLACADGRCLVCGEESQVCCNGEKCGGDLQCYNGTCMSCGTIGHPCCKEGQACIGQDLFSEGRTECNAGACRECGFGDIAVCTSKPDCNEGYLNNNGLCLTCGGANQPCCQADSVSICNKGLKCATGFCIDIK